MKQILDEKPSKGLKILLLEDESSLAEIIRMNLQFVGYIVQWAQNTKEADNFLRIDMPDLILTDWMLPGIQGTQWVKMLREQNIELPIVMMTARSQEDDMIEAFNCGVDDFLFKPFSMKQLTARIHGHLRRVVKERENQNTVYSWNNDTIVLDLETRSISYKENNVVVQATNFLVMLALLKHADKAIRRDALLEIVWPGQYIDERTIDVQVKRLRAELDKIHPCLRHTIEAVRGVGYRFNSLLLE